MSSTSISIPSDRLATFKSAHLQYGSHSSFDEGACAMEMVAFLAGESHSDHPDCTCYVLASFVRSWNDALKSDEERDQLLKPLLPKLINTRSTPAVENARGLLALDWAIRESLPTWLEQVDFLREYAAKLRAHREIVSKETASIVRDDVLAAYSAASSAAISAAYSAARSAARSAASLAAYSASSAAAYSASRAAASSAADSASSAAAYSAARSAASLAAYSALAPTVGILQQSALDLVERMISIEEPV